MNCILCKFPDITPLLSDHTPNYFGCSHCGLYFMNPSGRLPKEEEKKRYDLHQNNPRDPKYREFLKQIHQPMTERLVTGLSGLDFGSGPGPTLHLMFEEAGYKMNLYDPFYHPDTAVLNKTYDFIVTTESAEHFYQPADEFDRLWALLNPGGILGVMTQQLNEPTTFENWYYRRDDTHVVFYQIKTFEWLSKKYEAILEIINDRVILMYKSK